MIVQNVVKVNTDCLKIPLNFAFCRIFCINVHCLLYVIKIILNPVNPGPKREFSRIMTIKLHSRGSIFPQSCDIIEYTRKKRRN